MKKETIDNLSKVVILLKSVWSNIDINSPSPHKSNFSFIGWIEHIWKKIDLGMTKYFTIT